MAAEKRKAKKSRGATSQGAGAGSRLKMFLRLHRENFAESLLELLKTPLATFMTVLVLGIALAMPTGLYLILKNGEAASEDLDTGVQIALFVKDEVSDEATKELVKTLRLSAETAAVTLITREEALTDFKARSGFGDVLEYLDTNPLPASIIVEPSAAFTASDAAESLLEKYQALPEIDIAQMDVKWVKRLNAYLGLGKKMVASLALLLSAGVLLIIGNTIRLAIQNRRSEIEIIKLVGATDAFIRRPFLYTGFWYGILAGLISLLLVTLVVLWLTASVVELAGLYESQFRLASLNALEVLALLGIAAGLGLAGAWLSVSKHLRAIEPR